jgi:hypothetical protein
MKRISVFCFLSIAAIACNKDKFQTTPQIKIKSTSSKVVPNGGQLEVTFSFTDKEGDVADTMFMWKQRLNRRPVPKTLRDSIPFQIPEFPNHDQGEIQIDLDYQNHLISAQDPPRIPGTNPPQYEPDTLRLKFVLKDKAGHKSDTAFLDDVIVIR